MQLNLFDLLAVAGISSLVTFSIIGFLYKYVIPKVMGGFAEGMMEQLAASLKGHAMQEKAVPARLEKNLAKHFSADITNPENPIGAVLGLVPETRDYLAQHPEQITGLVNLIAAVPNIINAGSQIMQLVQKMGGKKSPEDAF